MSDSLFQEAIHDDSISVSTIGNFFYIFFYTFIEPSITGIFYLSLLVFIGIQLAVKSFWNTDAAVFAIFAIFAIVAVTLPITVFSLLVYLYLKVHHLIKMIMDMLQVLLVQDQ